MEEIIMRLMKISGLVLGVVCLSLAGCASQTSKKPKHRPHHEQESAMTQGVGESTEFINKDESNASEKYSENSRDKNTYLFAFDRFDVADHDLASINAHAAYLVKHPETKIYINGHTDQRGSREYNVALGERRAQAVTRILRSKGVAANQIKVVSYGSEKPAAMGNDENAYSQNRRAQTVYE